MTFFFKHLSFVSAFLALILLSGYLILVLLKFRVEKNYRDAFLVFLLGLFTVVAWFAISISGFKSVLMGLLIIGVFLLYDSRSRLNVKINDRPIFLELSFLLTIWIELVVVAGLIILYRHSFVYPGGYFIEEVYPDYVFYSKLSKWLIETGIESTNLDYIFFDKSLSPYHYFDIWINSIFILTTKQNAVSLMIYASYTVGISGVWLGIVGLIEMFISINWAVKITGFFLLFFCGMYWGDLIQISFIKSTSIFTRHTLNYSKLYPIYLIGLAAFQIRDFKKSEYLISLLLCLPLLNISIAPGAFILCGIIFIFKWYYDQYPEWIIILKALLIGTFIVSFYLVGSHTATGGWSFKIDTYLTTNYWRTVFNILVGAAIQFAIIFFPLILIVIVTRWNQRRSFIKYLVILILTYASFITPWALLHNNPNSVQLFSNFFVPFIFCFIIFILLKNINETQNLVTKRVLWGCLVGLALWSFTNDFKERESLVHPKPFDISEHPSYRNFFSNLKNRVGVYFTSEFDWASKASVFGSLDSKFQQFIDLPNLHTISLSIFEAPIDSSSIYYDYDHNLLTSSTFYKYIMRKKPTLNNGQISSEQILKYQIQFLYDNKVEYILTNYNCKLPDEIRQYAILQFSEPVLNIKAYSFLPK